MQKTKRSVAEEVPALLCEDEVLGENDWLEDDMKKPAGTRRKYDCNGYFSTGRIRKRNRSASVSPGEKIPSSQGRQLGNSQKKRLKLYSSDESEASDMETVIETNDEQNINNNSDVEFSDYGHDDIVVMFKDPDDDDENEIINIPTQNDNFWESKTDKCKSRLTLSHNSTTKNKQPKITNFGQVDLTQGAEVTENVTEVNLFKSQGICQQTNVLLNGVSGTQNSIGDRQLDRPTIHVKRITVKVQDLALLIPVVDPDGTKTFAWLAEEVASRYHQIRGVKLKLSLAKDGALFAPMDLVTLLLEDNEKVWNMEGICSMRNKYGKILSDHAARSLGETMRKSLLQGIET